MRRRKQPGAAAARRERPAHPISPHVLVEARVRQADIGFVKTGQSVQVKLSAYEYTVYGALQGTVLWPLLKSQEAFRER